MSAHEGPSIWTWGNYRGLIRRMSLELTKAQITPNTAEMMAMAEEAGTADINYTECKRRLFTRLMQDWQCPAQHPVVPLEIRAVMPTVKRQIQVFPNADGMPVGFIPIRCYLCPVCQEVYQERDILPRGPINPVPVEAELPPGLDQTPGDYTQARGAAPNLSDLSPEAAIRRGRD